MRQLSEEHGHLLVTIARSAIEGALGAPLVPDPDGDWLKEQAATFVTIMRRGELHGCIGTLEAKRPLIEDVKHNAIAAAFYDPRATRLRSEDVEALRIEISLLSPLQPIDFTDEADALAQLRPHVDGVVLEHLGRRATFLPQVWESLPETPEFIAHLKQKAGLSADFWSPSVKLFRYSLQKWKEPDQFNLIG